MKNNLAAWVIVAAVFVALIASAASLSVPAARTHKPAPTAPPAAHNATDAGLRYSASDVAVADERPNP